MLPISPAPDEKLAGKEGHFFRSGLALTFFEFTIMAVASDAERSACP